ncbi:Holliday junction resolvase [Pseudomonas phage vB_PpuM-SKa-4]
MHSQITEVYSLGFDPGKNNFAWTFTLTTNVGGKLVPEILEMGYVLSPLKNLTEDNLMEGTEHFFFDMRILLLMLLQKYGRIDIVVAERFQARGQKTGTTSEVVSMMIGLLIRCIRECHISPDVRLVIASSWKNSYNRCLDDKEALRNAYKLCRAEAHELDASLISLYGANKVIQRSLESSGSKRIVASTAPNVFKHFVSEVARDLWLSIVECKTGGQLVNRKAKRKYHAEAPNEQSRKKAASHSPA